MAKMRTQPPFSIFTAICPPDSFSRLLSLSASDGFLRRRLSGFRRDQSHLRLELLDQFAGADLLRFLFDLELLLVYIAQRHIQARFVDRSHLLHLAHHVVVRLADAAYFELFHRVGHLFLPLGAPVVANGAHGFLGLAVFFAQERLLHVERLFESRARGAQLTLRSRQSAAHLFQLYGVAAGDIVASGLDGRFDFGSQVGHIALVLGLFAFQQRLVRLDHGDALVHARHLVIHVANVLLEDQLRILGHGNEKSDERADGAAQPVPHDVYAPLINRIATLPYPFPGLVYRLERRA